MSKAPRRNSMDTAEKGIKLYVDDIREAPDGWTLVTTISEAIRFIARYSESISEISLDHDISFEVRVSGVYRPFPSPDTFASVAYFIGEKYTNRNSRHDLVSALDDIFMKNLPKITIHTSNPVGAETMEMILANYGFKSEIKPMGEAFRKK